MALKVAPRKCAASNFHQYTDAKSRFSEAAAKKGQKLDRPGLNTAASKMCMKYRRSMAFGFNVVDVELIVLKPCSEACSSGHIAMDNFGIKTGIMFGNVSVPVPVSSTGRSWRNLAEPVLQAMYPNGFKVPVYRHAVTGKVSKVPKMSGCSGHWDRHAHDIT
jgi:hypothetical protein